jgi:hypothetical protein
MSAVVNDFNQAGNHLGNYCVIQFTDNIIIRHSRNRSFELWRNDTCTTNLFTDSNLTNIWASHELHIDPLWNQTLHNIVTDQLPISGTLTADQAMDQIAILLDNSVNEFFTHNRPDLQVYFSGGVDTLLIYSLLKYNNRPFELIPYTHYDQDYFTTHNYDALNFFWNYKQIHHWRDPSWLATGSHGDEYFLRGPEVIAMLTAWHNINFTEVMAQHPDSYHYLYFAKKPKIWTDAWANRKKLQEQFPTEALLHGYILNFLLNDYQYLHLGNTLTWTPFKNIEIVRILLRCPIHELIPQFIDAKITKNLIARTDKSLLTALSRYKNHNSSENVLNLLEYHKKTLVNQ